MSCDPAIPLLGIHLEKTIIWKDTCTSMFTTILFTIAQTWRQPICPSTEQWIKLWYMYTMKYYPAIKKNELMPFASTQMDLEIIIPSEVSQRKTNIIWFFIGFSSYAVYNKEWYEATGSQRRNRLEDFETKLMANKRETLQRGVNGRLGLTYTQWHIWNGWVTQTYCMAQRMLFNAV